MHSPITKYVPWALSALLLAAGVLRADDKKLDPETQARVDRFEKGPASIDVSAYPAPIKANYEVFREKCALCHKEPVPGKPVLGKPLEMVAGGKTDAFLKEAITNPKKAIDPKVKMPEFKLTDEQLQDVIAYLKSIAKH